MKGFFVEFYAEEFFQKLPTIYGPRLNNNKNMGTKKSRSTYMAFFAAVTLLFVAAVYVCGAGETASAEENLITVEMTFGDNRSFYEDIPLEAPDFTVTSEFHDRRINAPYAEKIRCVEENLSRGSSPKAALLYCFPLLEQKVDEIIKSVNCLPVDATITFKPYARPMFYITREHIGYSVNEQRLYYDIYNALRKSPSARVKVSADELKPSVTAEELKTYTALRASFTTDYSHSNENRKHNIRLALSKINGKTLKKGEEFSFNKTVGKRSAANGFQEAKIILEGEYVEGVGGGVCQASTTVYNCALLADMKITSVRNHSLAPSYIAPSFDAMVNSGSSDMKFVNESDGPVFIRAYGDDTTAHVEIYGLKMPYKIVKESKVVSRSAVPEDKFFTDTENKYVSEEMLSGETKRVSYGAAGLSSEGYLSYYRNGVLIERKLIRKDVYRSVQGLVAVKP